jgi:uncharacterized membrane protein
MRYFLATVFVFAVWDTPWLEPMTGDCLPCSRANIALAVGLFLSGLQHYLRFDHYERLLPVSMPGKRPLVMLSATFRCLFAFGLWLPTTRAVAAIASGVLLLSALPVNVRVAQHHLAEGQLVPTVWFLWLRVMVHLSWIVWCIWCWMIQ